MASEMRMLLDVQKAAQLRDGAPSAAIRIDRIDRCIALLVDHRAGIEAALNTDFGSRSTEASAFTDVAASISTLKDARKSLKSWMKPEKRKTTPAILALFGAKAEVRFQPKGVIGIISPWNFPVNLTFTPLAGVLAAGNRAMIKPSEFTPATSALMAEMFAKVFSPEEIAVITGGSEAGQEFAGLPFDHLPGWVARWAKSNPSLISVTDINHDGILQLGEIRISGDLLVLAAPEIAGLPYVISGMVAAGGLAAALSTADGLLLTISNALSHDVYFKLIAPEASRARRVTVSKVLLLVAALCAAALATQKPTDILFLVTAAFSIAASALFPALVMGVFWSRANGWGAVFGMASGLGVTLYYMIRNEAWLRSLFGVTAVPDLWFGVLPISAGVFGVPVGFAVGVLVSLMTPAPSLAAREFVRRLRYPKAD